MKIQLLNRFCIFNDSLLAVVRPNRNIVIINIQVPVASARQTDSEKITDKAFLRNVL